jgi:hypothetical protein
LKSTEKLQIEAMAKSSKELLANIPPFGLRMQADLKDRIKAAAEENGRSMNAEIVARLEASFSERDSKAKVIIRNLVHDLQSSDHFNPDSKAQMEALLFLEDVPYIEISTALHIRDHANSMTEALPERNHDRINSIAREMELRTVGKAVKFLHRMGFKLTPPKPDK